MHTILVPTDFSLVAKNAAAYAVNLAKQLGSKKIILYNAYQQPIIADANMVPVELVDINLIKDTSTIGLNSFKREVESLGTEGIDIETIGEYDILMDGINAVCREHNVDIIVMGVTGGGKFDETLIGSNAVNVAKQATVPVIIAPPGTKFTTINKVVFACDFKDVVETTPVGAIKHLLNETKAKLLVLNIDHNHKHFSQELPFEGLMLDNLLDGYDPEYHFVDSPNFVEAVNSFAEDNEADLVITIPKKHNFFEKIFTESHTKQLAFHSHVPLMVIHE
jgi:nucleotide-binding universal stress UspA family protein